MPTMALVSGIAMQMYYEDHDPPHFHARAADFMARIAISDYSVISVSGRMRQADYRVIVEWAHRHKRELLRNWVRAQEGESIERIGA